MTHFARNKSTVTRANLQEFHYQNKTDRKKNNRIYQYQKTKPIILQIPHFLDPMFAWVTSH